jgi:cell wall-associated NlpC family hydrolase
MTHSDLDVLARAHALFAGATPAADGIGSRAGIAEQALANFGQAPSLPQAYRGIVRGHVENLGHARDVDTELSAILRRAHLDHREAENATRAVLNAARADASHLLLSPIAQRELFRRKAARLRAQREHVLAARRLADRRRTTIAALRYRLRRYKRDGLAGADSSAAVAVRAALTRLGCPYVWGATGPDRFDCSGLVQWAYAQAGMSLPRTTYDQIHVGISVARSDVQPGDLVFPHAGHVQLAIGDNLVIEAPYSGASVRVSPLGGNVTIRRP